MITCIVKFSSQLLLGKMYEMQSWPIQPAHRWARLQAVAQHKPCKEEQGSATFWKTSYLEKSCVTPNPQIIPGSKGPKEMFFSNHGQQKVWFLKILVRSKHRENALSISFMW